MESSRSEGRLDMNRLQGYSMAPQVLLMSISTTRVCFLVYLAIGYILFGSPYNYPDSNSAANFVYCVLAN
jgi:hypothetical protein